MTEGEGGGEFKRFNIGYDVASKDIRLEWGPLCTFMSAIREISSLITSDLFIDTEHIKSALVFVVVEE